MTRTQTLLSTRDKKALEPIFSGTLNDRFFMAVHEQPALFYDVVKTGEAVNRISGKTSFFEIVLLHAGNVDDALLEKMLMNQAEAAAVQKPHSANKIDYKSEYEVIAHFTQGGLGFGIFTPDGTLIGQNLISKTINTAHIGWLIVDRNWGGNGLSEALIDLSCQLGRAAGFESVTANVRISNHSGFNKFSRAGFEGREAAFNQKDGSKSILMVKPF